MADPSTRFVDPDSVRSFVDPDTKRFVDPDQTTDQTVQTLSSTLAEVPKAALAGIEQPAAMAGGFVRSILEGSRQIAKDIHQPAIPGQEARWGTAQKLLNIAQPQTDYGKRLSEGMGKVFSFIPNLGAETVKHFGGSDKAANLVRGGLAAAEMLLPLKSKGVRQTIKPSVKPSADVPVIRAQMEVPKVDVEQALKENRVPLDLDPTAPPNVVADQLADRLFTLNNLRQIDAKRIIDLSKDLGTKAQDIAGAGRAGTLFSETLRRYQEDPRTPLSPAQKQLFDTTLKPIVEENKRLFVNIKNLTRQTSFPVEDLNPDYLQHIPKGKGFFKFFQREADTGDVLPDTGRGGYLRTSDPSLRRSHYYALVDDSGNRIIANLNRTDNLVTQWKDQKPSFFGRLKTEKTPGGIRLLDKTGKPWRLERATIDELHQNTKVRYETNSAVINLAQYRNLRDVERNIKFLNDLKDLPQFNDGTLAVKEGAQVPPAGFRKTKLWNFQNYYMNPHIAEVLDDFAGHYPESSMGQVMQGVNNFATRSLFYNPLPHMGNIMDHWLKYRGASAWVNPYSYKRMGEAFAKAAEAVTTQNKDYEEYLMNGGSLMYGKSLTRDITQELSKNLQDSMLTNPQWGDLAKAVGLPKEAVKGWYTQVNRTMWMGTDILQMEAVYETMAKKNMPLPEAIRYVEDYMPSYRIPHRVMGSRLISETIQNRNLFVFSPYHYGMLKSHLMTLKNLVDRGVPAEERLEAMDRAAALAIMLTVVYPALDEVAKKVTGNKDASVMRYGASRVPQSLYEMVIGDRTPGNVAREFLTPAPASSALLQLGINTNLFTRKPIYYPGDIVEAPDVFAQDIAQGTMQAVSPIWQAYNLSSGKTGVDQFLLSQVGVKSPTPEQVSKKQSFKTREERQRIRHDIRSKLGLP